jgi:hypothetical protein
MPSRNAAPPDDKLALDKPTFCGTVTEARHAVRERRERKPQPWAVRKLMVVVFAIMGYTCHWVRLCGAVLCAPYAWRSAARRKCYFFSLNERGSLTIVLLVVRLLVS